MASVPEAEVYPVLKGKVAIVTGASRGIGKATASAFLRAGAKVVICSTNEQDGQAAAKELSALGEVRFARVDISKSEEVQNLIAFTVEAFQKLDICVNNAAMVPDSVNLADFDEDCWRRLVDVNVNGTAYCCKYAMRRLIEQGSGGSIINIVSVTSFRPFASMPAYTSSKHALIGLTKHASVEGGPHGIRVNAIAPGSILTALAETSISAMGKTPDELAPLTTSLNRFGMPHEVAQGALRLASDAASFVTGACLPIDGGFLAK